MQYVDKNTPLSCLIAILQWISMTVSIFAAIAHRTQCDYLCIL